VKEFICFVEYFIFSQESLAILEGYRFENGTYYFTEGENTFCLEQLVGMILKNIKKYGSGQAESDIKDAVFTVPAHWELMPIIVKMRNEISKETLIIGNGDINSIDEAKKKIQETGCDGVMIGRGIFGNPWFFSNKNIKDITIKERLTVMLEHAKAFNKYLGKIKNFAIMKKHFKAYVSEFDGAKELRIKLMESNGLKEVEKIVKDYIKML
jgi:hypothetical protein